MANEDLESFTDRLDQLFIRRSMKESSYLESLGEQLEESLQRATGNIGDAVSRVEEAVRRGAQGQGVSVEGMSPPSDEVGIHQDVVTRRMLEAARTFESTQHQSRESLRSRIEGQDLSLESLAPKLENIETAIRENFQSSKIRYVENQKEQTQQAFQSVSSEIQQQNVQKEGQENVQIEASFSEEARRNIDEIISEEESTFQETENFFGGFTERVFNYIEGLSTQYGDQQQSEQVGALQDVLEPLQSAIPDQSQNLGTAQVGRVQRIVNEINSSFTELASSSDVTKEQTEEVKKTFQSLSSEIGEIQKQVVKEQMTIEEASEKIENITSEIQGQFETTFGGSLENKEEVVRKMKTLSGKFSQNMRESVVQAQQMDDIGAGDMSEIAIAVQQFTSKDLNVPFAGLNENIENAKEKAGDFAEIFVDEASSAITAMNVGLGATLASLGAGIDLFEDARDAAQSLREETGIGRQRMGELRRDATRLRPALAEAGLNAQALADIQTTLIDRFGSAQTATAVMDRNLDNIRKSSAQIADSFGISAEKAAQNLASFEQLSRFVGGSADYAITFTEQLSRANDVAPQAAMEQIAGNAEELAKYAGQSVERLASTAVEAQRLGINLEEVTQFQEQALFNITDQIQKTQKANLLLDARIDSVRLLEASYEGTGATLEEIERQVQGIDFGSIDPFSGRALEDVFGMSVNQLERIKEGAETLKQMEETTSNLSSAVASGDLTLRQALASGEDRDAITRLTRQLNGLYVVFAKELAPVISDFIENILPGLTAALDLLTPLVRGLGMGVRFALSPLQSLSSLLSGDLKGSVEAITSPFQELKQMFGMTAEEGQAAGDAISGLAGTIGSLLGMLAGGGAILKTGSFLGGWIQSLGGSVASFFETQAIRGLVWKDKIVGAFSAFRSKADDVFSFVLKKGKNAFSGLITLGRRFGGMLGQAGQAVAKFGSRVVSALPSFTRMGAFFRLMRIRAVSFAAAIPGLTTAMTAVSGALSTATTAMYGFATSLSATGIGTIALGIAAAVGGAVYAFYNWEETVQFVQDAFNSFMSAAFEVENAASAVSSAVQTAGEWFSWAGSQIFSFGQTVGDALGLDYVASLISSAVGYMGNLISKFYEGKNAAEVIGSTLGAVFDVALPIDEIILGINEVFELIAGTVMPFFNDEFSLGEAIKTSFYNAVNELSDIGYYLVDMFIPDSLTSYLGNKIEGLLGLVPDFFPQSPLKRGPLRNLVGAGEALIDMIFDAGGYAAEMASGLVSSLFGGLTTAIKSGIQRAQRVFYETIDFVGALTDKFQSTKGSLIEKIKGTGRMILEKILPEGADIDAAVSKLMESFSVIANIADSFTPFDEAYNYITRLIGGLQDLGSAVTDGSFGQIDDILFDMVGDLGYNLVDMIFPDALTEYVARKMDSLAGTIRSYLPFSPAEVGPLSALDEVDIGAEVAANIDTQKVQAAMEEMGSTVKSVAKTVLPDPVTEGASDVVSSIYNTFTGGEGEAAPQREAAQETATTMTAQTVTIQTDAIRAQAEAGQFAQPQVRQEAGAMAVEEDLAGRGGESQVNVQPASQQPEMNVQPAQEGVATIDRGTVQTQSQPTEQQQGIRVDSDTTSLEDLLRQIRNSQQQLLSELQNGNIAVYLDGRKVNREMLRNLNVAE